MSKIKFSKMHGLGNDFMVIDAISQSFTLNTEKIQSWGNRHTGVGFDQLLLVESTQLTGCDFRYRIFNQDGSEVEQCGNGARCFAQFVTQKGLTDKSTIKVETQKGSSTLSIQENGLVKVYLTKPKFDLDEIPFIPHHPNDTKNFTQTIVSGTLSIPFTCVNIGNPHAVILVEEVDKAPVELWGEEVSKHKQFPEGVNVGFLEVINRTQVKLRVFERGVGETEACGTGACAAVVSGIRLGLLDHQVTVFLKGGSLDVEWHEGEEIIFSGPTAFVYEGEINLNDE